MAANPLDNGGRKRSYSTGTPGATSKSPRPAKRPLPTDLDNGGRERSYSTGTRVIPSPEESKRGGEPQLKPIPRGYVHSEPSFQPSTRKVGHRIKKGAA